MVALQSIVVVHNLGNLICFTILSLSIHQQRLAIVEGAVCFAVAVSAKDDINFYYPRWTASACRLSIEIHFRPNIDDSRRDQLEIVLVGRWGFRRAFSFRCQGSLTCNGMNFDCYKFVQILIEVVDRKIIVRTVSSSSWWANILWPKFEPIWSTFNLFQSWLKFVCKKKPRF